MNITWKYIKPLENSLAVKNYLIEQQVVLPVDLVELLEKCNGGRPSDKTIITDTSNEYVFKSLFSFNKKDTGSIYNIYPDLFGDSALFPFGSDSSGNIICFNTKSQSFVLYNHETDRIEKIIDAPFLKSIEIVYSNDRNNSANSI